MVSFAVIPAMYISCEALNTIEYGNYSSSIWMLILKPIHFTQLATVMWFWEWLISFSWNHKWGTCWKFVFFSYWIVRFVLYKKVSQRSPYTLHCYYRKKIIQYLSSIFLIRRSLQTVRGTGIKHLSLQGQVEVCWWINLSKTMRHRKGKYTASLKLLTWRTDLLINFVEPKFSRSLAQYVKSHQIRGKTLLSSCHELLVWKLCWGQRRANVDDGMM